MDSISLKPIFIGNYVAICFSCNTDYAPVLATALCSIIGHADASRNYDITILYESLDHTYIKRIEGMACRNFSIRMYCISELIKEGGLMNFHTSGHLTRETYFRFLIPDLFAEYSKVLYLDCDIIATRDIACLYDTTLDSDTYLAAVPDSYVRYLIAKGDRYFKEKMKLSAPENYFQAGILLINLDAFRVHGVREKIFNTIQLFGTPRYHDQDIINIACDGHVLFLDFRWNLEYHLPIWIPDYARKLRADFLQEYEKSFTDPWIIHFTGAKKPWEYPEVPYGDMFWKYARMTPFYEDMVYKYIQNNSAREIKNLNNQLSSRGTDSIADIQEALKGINQRIREVANIADIQKVLGGVNQQIREVAKLPSLRHELRLTRWKIRLSWGTRKQSLLRRKQKLKQEIKAIEKFLKAK